ncbi:hypothetical protein PQO01_12045 [Lentisphaera marina]|uniref:hypothetical protein n=1 Tax=Lentisphaera marina TaxID=1111041 RepID=UPI0023658068|nr:hypothetical protein [Lentisphaera marina]MDD7985682.1 hypothetical protein [Lentisphaera marina]
MSHESQYPLKNEVDEPAINAVYVILIVTAVFIAISIIGLRSYESMIAEKNREAREQAPTVELNEMREANQAKMTIIDKVLAEQGKTK